MICVILQPSYIPWRGYFHQIQRADVFVFYDDVQYDKHGWRNRNRIKTPQGSQWLTIPILTKGALDTPINQIQIAWNTRWNDKHWASLKQNYGKAPFFKQYSPMLEELYRSKPQLLADFTIDSTIQLARELGLHQTKFIRSSSLNVTGVKTDRILQILKQLGATHYISGPAAKDYLEEEKFAEAGIGLEYIIYDYQEYPQLYPPFDPQVTILDLLFMMGPEAPHYIWEK